MPNVLLVNSPKVVRLLLPKYPRSFAMSNAASTSINDPREISKNRFLSASDFLEHPSAIFNTTDNPALLTYWIILNLSSGGNALVIL